MKHFLILILLVAFSFGTFAQQNTNLKVDGTPVNIDKLKKEFRQRNADNKGTIGWLIPAWDILDNYYATYDYVTHYANVMFQDSSAIYESGGNLTNNWICGVGGVLEPYSMIFDTNLIAPIIDPGTPYEVDSLMLLA